jgi:two-component system chemotaxis response regulator CheY
MNVLIVDDSRAIYAMVSQMLQEGGHTSVWAEDGLKAIEILAKDKTINMILLDWNMPNMNGLEFLEKNKSGKLTSAPIIMMTTENSPDKIKQALSLDAAEYIMKPFSKDILFNKFTLIELMQ